MRGLVHKGLCQGSRHSRTITVTLYSKLVVANFAVVLVRFVNSSATFVLNVSSFNHRDVFA